MMHPPIWPNITTNTWVRSESHFVCRDQRHQLFHCQTESRYCHRGASTTDPAMVEKPELVQAIRLSDRSGRGWCWRPGCTSPQLRALRGIPALAITDKATRLAAELVRRGALPRKATVDAFHIGIAAAHQIEYLVTWNCKHIATRRCVARSRRFAAPEA